MSDKDVKIKVISQGNGCTFPKTGQKVTIHYTGKLENGKVFDCSRERDAPFSFHIGKEEAIKGWDVGLRQMSLGQRAELTCPPCLCYGKRGFPGVIPPESTLIFDIELLHLN